MKIRIAFWNKIEEFEDRKAFKERIDYLFAWVVPECISREQAEKELKRLEQEVAAGADRAVVYKSLVEIPADFFDDKKDKIKVLRQNKVYEFDRKEDAAAFLRKAAEKAVYEHDFSRSSEEERLLFDAELVEKDCRRVVDWASEIPENFYE